MSEANESRTRPALYFVCEEGDFWMVSHSGAQYPYRSREVALNAAIDAANTSGKRGHRAEVQIRDSDDEWVRFWTYGIDPYPPQV